MRQRLIAFGLLVCVVCFANGCIITEGRVRAEVQYFVKHGMRKPPVTAKQDPQPPVDRPMALELTDLWRTYGDRLVPLTLEEAPNASTEQERVHVIALLATDGRWAPGAETYRNILEALYSGHEFTSYAGQIILEEFLAGSYPEARTHLDVLADIRKGLGSRHPWVRINCCGLLVRNTARRAKPYRELLQLVEGDPDFLVRLVAAGQLYLLDAPGKDQYVLDALATRDQVEPPFIARRTKESRAALEEEIVGILKNKEARYVTPVLPPYILRGHDKVDLRIYVMQIARIARADKAIPVIRELEKGDLPDVRAEARWVLKNWRWQQ